jgi:hypothetical protein
MVERRLKSYFRRQVRAMIEQAAEPEGFRDYFSRHEPSDEEIMGLLAVSTVSDGRSPIGREFPTAFEALAALSEPTRSAICQEFRRLLRASARYQ